MTEEPTPWERLAEETARAYATFRRFRDLGPARTLESTPVENVSGRTIRGWAKRHDWWGRAEAWDSEQYRIEDRERLEAIRTMHRNHQRLGRRAQQKALETINALTPEDLPAGAAVRLLELGVRIERSTLTVSVADLQGIEVEEERADDPWERIAAELTAAVSP